MKTLILLLTIYMSISANASSDKSQVCEKIVPLMKSGDLVFISTDFYLFQKVSEATSTWTNHVGVAFERDGQWLVAESKVPVSTITPLCEFVGRTRNNQVAVRRAIEDLSSEEVEALWESAQSKMNVLYNLGFNFESSRQFCSKFVYQMYLEVTGKEVGEIQTFKDVLNENPNGNQIFWKWWFIGRIPWERRTVTPKSQLEDPTLKTIWSWDS